MCQGRGFKAPWMQVSFLGHCPGPDSPFGPCLSQGMGPLVPPGAREEGGSWPFLAEGVASEGSVGLARPGGAPGAFWSRLPPRVLPFPSSRWRARAVSKRHQASCPPLFAGGETEAELLLPLKARESILAVHVLVGPGWVLGLGAMVSRTEGPPPPELASQ